MDSQVVLVAINLIPEHLAQIEKEVDQQATALPRVDILRVSISKSLIVKVKTVEEAFAFSNDYAPEHLILHLENAAQKVPLVENAGSVFVGPFTPERLAVIDFKKPTLILLSSVVAITLLERTIRCLQMVMQGSSVVSTPYLSKSTSHPKKLQQPDFMDWALLLQPWLIVKDCKLMLMQYEFASVISQAKFSVVTQEEKI